MKPAIAVILFLVGQVGLAHAEPDRSVLVVVSASDRVAGPVKVAAERAIAAYSWRVASAKPGIIQAMARCTVKEESKCLEVPLSYVRAGSVLIIRANESTGSDGEPQVILKAALFDRASIKVVKTTQRHCSRCHTAGQLTDLTDKLTTELVRGRAKQLAPFTNVKVITTPSNATLFLDGTNVGATGSSYRVAPGALEIRVKKVGYEPATQSVRLQPNQKLVIRIQLAPARAITQRPKRRYALWGLGVAGVTSVALGIQWLVVDRGADDGATQFLRFHPVKTRAVVGLGLGAMLLGTSAVLWYRGRRSAVTVTPTTGGVALLWRGSFE